MKTRISLTGSILSSLAGVYHRLRRAAHWIVHQKWLRLLKALKLVVEIIKDTRNLLFWRQPWAVYTDLG